MAEVNQPTQNEGTTEDMKEPGGLRRMGRQTGEKVDAELTTSDGPLPLACRWRLAVGTSRSSHRALPQQRKRLRIDRRRIAWRRPLRRHASGTEAGICLGRVFYMSQRASGMFLRPTPASGPHPAGTPGLGTTASAGFMVNGGQRWCRIFPACVPGIGAAPGMITETRDP